MAGKYPDEIYKKVVIIRIGNGRIRTHKMLCYDVKPDLFLVKAESIGLKQKSAELYEIRDCNSLKVVYTMLVELKRVKWSVEERSGGGMTR